MSFVARLQRAREALAQQGPLLLQDARHAFEAMGALGHAARLASEVADGQSSRVRG
jgi:hypothetical protein